MQITLVMRKYISDSSHVLQHQAFEFSKDLIYKEYSEAIVDRQVRQPRTKYILMVKVLRSNHKTEDCTWETEAVMQVAYPYIFHSKFVSP